MRFLRLDLLRLRADARSPAYLGNSAVFDFGSEKMSFAGGLVAAYLWRSVYWSEQVSMRTRLLLMIDWVKRGIWGRGALLRSSAASSSGVADYGVCRPQQVLNARRMVRCRSSVHAPSVQVR